MLVMNDRPQAGSSYVLGRIELMINRVGSTSDGLGVWESINDYSFDGKGINVSAKFYLTFTETRNETYRKIQARHITTMNQVQHFFSKTMTN
jgi:hypothetical protein